MRGLMWNRSVWVEHLDEDLRVGFQLIIECLEVLLGRVEEQGGNGRLTGRRVSRGNKDVRVNRSVG
jgi:hypothetical protein